MFDPRNYVSIHDDLFVVMMRNADGSTVPVAHRDIQSACATVAYLVDDPECEPVHEKFVRLG